jgi:hypothetical protein
VARRRLGPTGWLAEGEFGKRGVVFERHTWPMGGTDTITRRSDRCLVLSACFLAQITFQGHGEVAGKPFSRRNFVIRL